MYEIISWFNSTIRSVYSGSTACVVGTPMRLKYGQVIMPFTDGGQKLGVRVTWDSGTDLRAIRRICKKAYLKATGRKISTKWLEDEGILSNMQPCTSVDAHYTS